MINRKLDSELSEIDITINKDQNNLNGLSKTPLHQVQPNSNSNINNTTSGIDSDSVISPGDVNIGSQPSLSSVPLVSGVITTATSTATITTTTVVTSYQEKNSYNIEGQNRENEDEIESPLNPNLTRMIQEMEESNRRFTSRIKFLDTRLEVKEETIKKLNSRIEVSNKYFTFIFFFS